MWTKAKHTKQLPLLILPTKVINVSAWILSGPVLRTSSESERCTQTLYNYCLLPTVEFTCSRHASLAFSQHFNWVSTLSTRVCVYD